FVLCSRFRVCAFYSFSFPPLLRVLLSFPTRRSSDLDGHLPSPLVCGRSHRRPAASRSSARAHWKSVKPKRSNFLVQVEHSLSISDRKSTRLNSSHVSISYAVFCLKKKKREIDNTRLY